MGRPAYPFTPKSTAYLRPGQFWAIPLQNGEFACGRVLGLKSDSRRLFVAGLLDWSSNVPPDAFSIAGRKVIEQGQAHIKTITETGGTVLGWRSLESDGLRNEDPEHVWGYKVIQLLAEQHVGEAS